MFEVWVIADNIYCCLDNSISHAVYRFCIIRFTMTPQATAALEMAVLHLRKSGMSIKSVCQQTGVIERTQRRWITTAKKAGTWEFFGKIKKIYKFLNCSYPTYFSSIQVKSGIIGKEIAS